MKNFLTRYFPSFMGTYSINSEKKESNIDWVLFAATLPLLGAGLMTMNSFTGDSEVFIRQLIWIIISFCIFFASFPCRFSDFYERPGSRSLSFLFRARFSPDFLLSEKFHTELRAGFISVSSRFSRRTYQARCDNRSGKIFLATAY
jgi:hypothetical protein